MGDHREDRTPGRSQQHLTVWADGAGVKPTPGFRAQAWRSTIYRTRNSTGLVSASSSWLCLCVCYLPISFLGPFALVKSPQVHSSCPSFIIGAGMSTHRDPLALSGALSPRATDILPSRNAGPRPRPLAPVPQAYSSPSRTEAPSDP